MVKNFFLLKNYKNLFYKNTDKKKISKILKEILNENSQIIKSLGKTYQNSYKKKQLDKYKKSSNFRVIGMGGSALGTQAIYDFLKHKINKKFIFINDLQKKQKKETKKGFTNLVVSKSGNTIETIVNSNILIKKGDKNIFITENKKSYLRILAERLKAEIVNHNNFIGGRYSVLSEVGMLPTELMGLNTNNFKQLNVLIKNKKFFDSLVKNVASIFFLIKKKRYNSVIINYDEKSESLFNWYQQLVAESLGKKKKGILPVISKMPRDNHSVMQYYLEGSQKNLFTFFYVHDDKADKMKNQNILSSYNFLKNKKTSNIIYAQKKATENVFKKKRIPFRSFEILNRDEKTLGELFCFFILETILIGQTMKLNPFDQPAVELIKKETKKLLI
jgi:glucose-6-phosphate isomerase